MVVGGFGFINMYHKKGDNKIIRKKEITMGRTESKSIQVHPRDEQSTIDSMQNFGWELLNSQDVKTVDNHLERKGDTIYQVTEKEHYVKLTFTRSLDMPNLGIIKELEQEYNNLVITDEYRLFPGWLIALIGISIIIFLVNKVFGILLILGCGGAFYYNYSQRYVPTKAKVEEQRQSYPKRRQEILTEVSQLLT